MSKIQQIPTPEQELKLVQLKADGFEWDKNLSLSANGVVLKKGKETWIFSLDGEIVHAPIEFHFK